MRHDRVSLVNTGSFAERRDGSCKSRLLFMCWGDQHRSHLEHFTGHDDFTKNGVHYVTWLDVLLNISGRPKILDVKMLLIVAVSVVFTDLVVNNRSGVAFLDDGLSKDTSIVITNALPPRTHQ